MAWCRRGGSSLSSLASCFPFNKGKRFAFISPSVCTMACISQWRVYFKKNLDMLYFLRLLLLLSTTTSRRCSFWSHCHRNGYSMPPLLLKCYWCNCCRCCPSWKWRQKGFGQAWFHILFLHSTYHTLIDWAFLWHIQFRSHSSGQGMRPALNPMFPHFPLHFLDIFYTDG